MPLTLNEYAQHLRVTPDWLKQKFQLADRMSPTGEPVVVGPYLDPSGHKVAEMILEDWNPTTLSAIGRGSDAFVYNHRAPNAAELLVVANPSDVHYLASHGLRAVFVTPTDDGVACLLNAVECTPSIRRVLAVSVGSTEQWGAAFAGYEGPASMAVVDMLASTGAASFVQMSGGVSGDTEKYRRMLGGLAQDAHLPASGYTWDSRGTWMLKQDKEGWHVRPLANFSASVMENVCFDDGGVQSRKSLPTRMAH